MPRNYINSTKYGKQFPTNVTKIVVTWCHILFGENAPNSILGCISAPDPVGSSQRSPDP